MDLIPYRRAAAVDVRIVKSSEALAVEGARLFAALAEDAAGRTGRFTVALSGGATPQALFDRLASTCCASLDWRTIHIFWGDERPVPPTHPDSNYLMAKLHLLSKVPLPAANIHRIPAELPACAAAKAYSGELRSFFELAATERPRFDLIMLGLGEEGHTASLFPGSSALREGTESVTCADVPARGETRITMTFTVINAAACVLVLASGGAKRAIVSKALTSSPCPEALPIQGVRLRNGQLIWLLDQAASADLNPARDVVGAVPDRLAAPFAVDGEDAASVNDGAVVTRFR
jgi:6-phosphogluconolactonase